MNIENLMEQFICERIQVLMNRYLKEASGAIPGLAHHLCREAEKERMLYVSGVKDGFDIIKWLVM